MMPGSGSRCSTVAAVAADPLAFFPPALLPASESGSPQSVQKCALGIVFVPHCGQKRAVATVASTSVHPT